MGKGTGSYTVLTTTAKISIQINVSISFVYNLANSLGTDDFSIPHTDNIQQKMSPEKPSTAMR